MYYDERDLARDKRMGFDNDECYKRSLMVALTVGGGQGVGMPDEDLARLVDILDAQYKALCQQCDKTS